MGDIHTFGPNLRREREQRQISLERLAQLTKVSVDLWEGLERNDFSRWPSGIFARAFVRDYARVIGLDPDAVVDEFCRLFPVGDRRVRRIIEAQAELIGHTPDVTPGAEPLPAGKERRRSRRAAAAPGPSPYRPRMIAAAIDLACVGVLAAASAALVRGSFAAATGISAVLYFSAGTMLLGGTPGNRCLDVLRHRAPALFGRPSLPPAQRRRAVSA